MAREGAVVVGAGDLAGRHALLEEFGGQHPSCRRLFVGGSGFIAFHNGRTPEYTESVQMLVTGPLKRACSLRVLLFSALCEEQRGGT